MGARRGMPSAAGAAAAVLNRPLGLTKVRTRLNKTPPDVNRHIWRPRTCQLLAFDAKSFCKLLGGRRVVLIGDSTMGQTAATIMNAILHAKEACHVNIYFAKSDTLIGKNMGRLNRGYAWQKWVDITKAEIVVISAGGHIIRPTPNGWLAFMKQVVGNIKDMRRRHPNITVFWKTQQPGGCEFPGGWTTGSKRVGAKSPFRSSKGLQPTWWDDPKNFGPTETLWNSSWWSNYIGVKHNYDGFLARDKMSKDICLTHNVPTIDLEMLYYRIDAHPGSILGDPGNCMHACMPGPLNIFPALFQHALELEVCGPPLVPGAGSLRRRQNLNHPGAR
jgi:hypothetical protein